MLCLRSLRKLRHVKLKTIWIATILLGSSNFRTKRLTVRKLLSSRSRTTFFDISMITKLSLWSYLTCRPLLILLIILSSYRDLTSVVVFVALPTHGLKHIWKMVLPNLPSPGLPSTRFFFSDDHVLKYSLPQGSIIGPQGFTNMYTSPIGDITRKHNIFCRAYAYDVQLHYKFSPMIACDCKRAVSDLAACIAGHNSWMVQNKVQLNQDKTEFCIMAINRVLKTMKNFGEI